MSALGPTPLDTPCIEWHGPRMRTREREVGYGTIGGGNSKKLAHRVAYEQAFGPIPSGRMVLHRCDNPPCVSPDHLFLGDHASNARDMVAKGRHRGGARSGERNHFAKLSDADVARLRADREAGMTQRAAARKYGIGQTQAWRITHGHSRA